MQPAGIKGALRALAIIMFVLEAIILICLNVIGYGYDDDVAAMIIAILFFGSIVAIGLLIASFVIGRSSNDDSRF